MVVKLQRAWQAVIRAEARAKLAVVPAEPGAKGAPRDNPAALLGVFAWFERVCAPIDLEAAIAEMSGPDLITLEAQIMRAQAWFGQIIATRFRATGAILAAKN